MELCFENEKASVSKEINDDGKLVKIRVKYKGADETVEEYYIEEETPIYAWTTKYTTPSGAKATEVSLRCGIPQERMQDKLKAIVNTLKQS